MLQKRNIFWLNWPVHLFLFLLTFFSTTIAGVFWLNRDPFDLSNFNSGLPFSIAILFILSCHEFGHFFAARFHRVQATLPYYLPFPPIPIFFQLFLNFGTFGAVIRTKSIIPNKKAMFDIGVAGPIAGFVASCFVLAYGFTHLPGKEFILQIHPDYDFILNTSSSAHGLSLSFGSTLIFDAFRKLLTNPALQFVPPMSEIYHYPYLCVGWFGLFVTALNLIPIGQFDGGHIMYSMFGEAHKRIARYTSYLLIFLGLPSMADSLLRMALSLVKKHAIGQIVPFAEYSWSAWLIWAFIGITIVKLYHPPVSDETPLDSKRVVLGWIAIAIFIVSFSIMPISISN